MIWLIKDDYIEYIYYRNETYGSSPLTDDSFSAYSALAAKQNLVNFYIEVSAEY